MKKELSLSHRILWGLALLLLHGFLYAVIGYVVAHFYHLEARTPDIEIDARIDYIPRFIWIYDIYVIPIFLTFLFIVRDPPTYWRMYVTFLANLLISCAIYFLLPTTIEERPYPIGQSLTDALTRFTFSSDYPYNCFPSLHVSLITLASIFTLEKNRPLGALWFVAAAIISASTLVVKQHYFMDVVGGFGLALVVYLAVLYIWRARTRRAEDGSSNRPEGEGDG